MADKTNFGRIDLVPNDFRLVQTLVNKPFDLGVENASTGALSSDWSSLARFSDLEIAHKHVWIDAKCDSDLQQSAKHFLGVYATAPHDTLACVLLSHPRQLPTEWLKGWKTALNIPRGSSVISYSKEGTQYVDTAKHELRVLYYAPTPLLDDVFKKDSVNAGLDTDSRLRMLFAGRAANVPANILFDSGASTCFVLKTFCGLTGIVVEPMQGTTTLGNNHRVPTAGKARVHLKLGAFQQPVDCFVLEDLIDGVDVVLGNDFMLAHDVDLSYRTKCAIIHKGRRRITVNQTPLIREVVQQQDGEQPVQLLSALQVKRLARKGETIYLATLFELKEIVSDSGSSPSWVSELQEEFGDVF